MELIPDEDSYNYRYLEIEHSAGYKQLYELNERVSIDLIENAARQLKMRYVEAWASLMRGEQIQLNNSFFRLTK
jgi:hypothetical protein